MVTAEPPGGHTTLARDVETSRRMAAIRREDTQPELFVRRALTSLGVRYRVRNADLPGSPDIANRAGRWAILVHGCYWHRHDGCPRTSTPKRNVEFWLDKFADNVARDARVERALVEGGYRVLIIWECETKRRLLLAECLRTFMATVRRTGFERN